jgi:hypothetical protein
MPKLSDEQIYSIVEQEEADALDYHGEITRKRAKALDYYNCRPFGDEQEGQSQVVTSDVSDVIEGMLPTLLRIFTQGKNIAMFDADQADKDDEAEQKTQLANWVFLRQNNGVLILHNMFKDALLQYTGAVKVYWDEYDEVKTTRFQGLSDDELLKLSLNPEIEIEEQEDYAVQVQGPSGPVAVAAHDVRVRTTSRKGKVCIDNIPPEEFVIARRSRGFDSAPFIGHRSPKTRSQLIEMGFKKDIVEELPAETPWQQSSVKDARLWDLQQSTSNVTTHSPNDEIYLGEYYLHLDVDGDGVAELWQVFVAGNQLLSKEQVDDHPFAVCVPIPIPHRAIGSCPAEQAMDIQFRKSTLVRQLLNNVYLTNYSRTIANNRVDWDDLLTPRAGGLIRIDDPAPVSDSVMPLIVQPMAADLLQVIEYTNTEREVRTGVTRYNQGLDTDSLNKTATGFKGIQDMSQQRIDLIARIFAETGVKEIFKKIVSLCGKYQSEPMQIKATGKVLEIDPSAWAESMDCRIDVGIGSGDRNEKIINLNNILQTQIGMMQSGLVLSDQVKLYNTLDKLVTETGLKDVSRYFNNPEIPEETLFAQNQQLTMENMQLKASIQNPDIEKARIQAQTQILVDKNKHEGQMAVDAARIQNEMSKFMLQMSQQQDQFMKTFMMKLTELDMKYNAEKNDIEGTLED